MAAKKTKPKYKLSLGNIHGLTSRITQCLGETVNRLDCEDALVEELNVVRDHAGLGFVLPPADDADYRETFAAFCEAEGVESGKEFYDHVVAIRKWCDIQQNIRGS